MSKLLTSFLFVLPATYLFAQDAEPPQSFQKDIGFNTTFILQGILESDQTPFSLMYKKYTSENQAIRFGANVFLSLNDNSSNTNMSYYYNSSAALVSLVIGKEFQKPIDKRWIWYFGGDLVPYYTFNSQDYFDNGELYSESENSNVGIGIRPFLGIRFNINPRLYLSAEANATLQYGHSTSYFKYSANSEANTDTDGNNFSLSMSPATGLFLFYRF